MIYLFAIIYFILAIVNVRILKTRLNSFNIIFTPYVFILLFNNLVMKNTFLPITSDAVFVLIGGMLLYEIGMILYYGITKTRLLTIKNEKIGDFGNVDMDRVNYTIVSRFIVSIVILRFVIIANLWLRGGLSAIAGNDYQGMNMDPITGRLVICLFPAGWLIAYKLFSSKEISTKKRIYYTILLLAVLGIQFLGAVKAHAMIFAVGVFLIAVYCNRKNIARGGVALIGVVIVMFFGNYALSWLTIDNSIPTMRYTLYHFWKYIAGGSINLGGMISDGSTTYGFSDLWIAVLLAIPNEFLYLIGVRLTGDGTIPYISGFPRVSYALGDVGYYYERSNVVNLLGRMYGNGNILGFATSVIIFAFVSEWAMKTYRTNNKPNMFMISIVLLSYEFVSFFAFYYSSTHFWQMLIYSAVFTFAVQVKWRIKV